MISLFIKTFICLISILGVGGLPVVTSAILSGFSLGRLHMGGGGEFVPPYGGTSAGRQSVNGGGDS